MIGIIDYGMGNLRSVEKAFELVGAEVVIVSDPTQIKRVDQLVLPGVGAFADGMENLTRLGWVEPVRRFITSGNPFLGICLGLQLLFEGSQEDAGDLGLVPGLSVLPGRVVRFSFPPRKLDTDGDTTRRLKIPHMGWNFLHWDRDDPLLRGLAPQADLGQVSAESPTNGATEHRLPGPGLAGVAVYFVHSYYAQPVSDGNGGDGGESIVSARTDYGGWFCASLWRDNVWATQFHPEKSQKVGLRMLANFASV